MSFSNPWALLLLAALVYFIWLAGALSPRVQSQSRQGRLRDRLSLGTRLLIVLLMVLALAGSQVVRGADNLAVVFLLDMSDSVSPEQRERAIQFIQTSMVEMGPDDQAALVVFGGSGLVDRPMSGLTELSVIRSAPNSWETNIASAIRLGLALFPAGSARRMVLLTDGVVTAGDTREAARLAAMAGAPIDVIDLTAVEPAAEVWLTAVDAPTRVVQGETFSVNVVVQSAERMPATLRLLSGGAILYEQPVDLAVGENNFSIRLTAVQPEFARYQVQIEPARDTYYQNNQLAAFTEVVGPPRILMVANEERVAANGEILPDEAAILHTALTGLGLSVERVTPAQLSPDLGELSRYASLLMVNVSARELSVRKMEALQIYVRDLGGGLVAVGGPNSFGMGGYFQTPLEELLPVEMQIKDQERFAPVSIAIVIDRSGSMSMPEGGLTKIQLAGEAAARVVEMMNPGDEITVIPVDTRAFNPIGPVVIEDKEAIIAEIRKISAGGGGIYVYTGLVEAQAALGSGGNQTRHIIVLADGADAEQKQGVEGLLRELTADGVTITMVAIGDGPDVAWLRQMAEVGEGRFHFTNEAANLPQIFAEEAAVVQRSYLIEERFFARLVSASPILSNIRSAPALEGYVGTTAKSTAQVILETHQGDPLLAVWQYGLGRSVAWTSDATGRWALDWVSWDGFPVFWAQLARWSLSQVVESSVATAVTVTEQGARLTVDARDVNGRFLNGLDLEANVVSPAGVTTNVTLHPIAPGQYEADFSLEGPGAYFIRVAGGDEETTVGQTVGWVSSYPAEYREFEPNPQLLTAVSEVSGGRQLSMAEPAAVFERNLRGQPVKRPIWGWLVVAAVLLLPVDVGLRRLAVTQEDWRRLRAATLGRFWPETVTVERPAQVSRLFAAKERAGRANAADPAAPLAGEITSPVREATPPEKQERPSTPPPTPPAAAPQADKSGSPLASRLLAKKRANQEE
jgi:uncharacterized membrane protein